MFRYILPSLLTLTLGAQAAPSTQTPPPPSKEPAQATAQTQAPQPAPAAAPATQPSANKPPMPALRPQPTPHPVPQAKEESIPEDQVIARLGNRLIHERDFHAWLKALAGKKRFEQMAKTPGTLTRIRTQFLDSQVLAAKARKEGIPALPAFKEKLKAQTEQILVQTMMSGEEDNTAGKRLNDKIENPSDDEIRAYFDKNAQRFDTPEKFSARHILVGLKGAPRMGDKGLTDEEAKAKIAKIQAELAAGKKIEELTKENSDDPSNKNNGGLIKDAAFGGFAPEFEEAVRKQEIGKVGEPVKTKFGYHLILVESRTPKQTAVFEQVKERAKQQMLPERREAMNKAFVEEAKKEFDFVAGPEAEKSLPKKPAKTAKTSKK